MKLMLLSSYLSSILLAFSNANPRLMNQLGQLRKIFRIMENFSMFEIDWFKRN